MSPKHRKNHRSILLRLGGFSYWHLDEREVLVNDGIRAVSTTYLSPNGTRL